MSRGLGRVQRAVLAHLEEPAQWPARDTFLGIPNRLNVIVYVTGYHPESVRRAMKSLEKAGYVELGWDSGWRLLSNGEVFNWWDRGAPTARLSAARLSTLNNSEGVSNGNLADRSAVVEEVVDAFHPAVSE